MNAVTTFFKRDGKITFFTMTIAITFLFFGHGAYTNATGIPLLPVAQQDGRGERTKPLRANGAALDVHTHIARQALTDFFTGGGVPAPGVDDLIAKLDEAHVKRAVILSAAYFGLPDDSNVEPSKPDQSERHTPHHYTNGTDANGYTSTIDDPN